MIYEDNLGKFCDLAKLFGIPVGIGDKKQVIEEFLKQKRILGEKIP